MGGVKLSRDKETSRLRRERVSGQGAGGRRIRKAESRSGEGVCIRGSLVEIAGGPGGGQGCVRREPIAGSSPRDGENGGVVGGRAPTGTVVIRREK